MYMLWDRFHAKNWGREMMAAKLGNQLVACDMIMCTDYSVHQGNPNRLLH